MSEPRTAAGRALLIRLGVWSGVLMTDILAIEDQATLIGFDDAWNKAEARELRLRGTLALIADGRGPAPEMASAALAAEEQGS